MEREAGQATQTQKRNNEKGREDPMKQFSVRHFPGRKMAQ